MKKLTILTLSLLMVSALLTQAAASDWNFYGSARLSTFIEDTDQANGKDTNTFNQTLHGNSRIGAQVRVSDTLSGRFEYGAGNGTANIRLLYGEWDFGTGNLLVGQTYTPLGWFYSKQAYNDKMLLSYGAVYGQRNPMLRLRFGELKIAAVTPGTDALGVTGGILETQIPRFEVSYRYKMDKAFVDLGAGYCTYALTDPSTGYENDIRSYIIALGTGVNFGRYYLRGNVWLGQNTGPYGMYGKDAPHTAPELTLSGDNVIDNNAFGFVAVAGAKLSPGVSLEAGYGYTEAELDKVSSHEDGAASYYVQTTLTLSPGVFVIPEIGVIDNKSDINGMPESEILYYGIKWQINF